MNLTKDEKQVLSQMVIDPESLFHKTAYTSKHRLNETIVKRLETFGLCETNGLGYRLTVDGRKSLRTGRYRKNAR